MVTSTLQRSWWSLNLMGWIWILWLPGWTKNRQKVHCPIIFCLVHRKPLGNLIGPCLVEVVGNAMRFPFKNHFFLWSLLTTLMIGRCWRHCCVFVWSIQPVHLPSAGHVFLQATNWKRPPRPNSSCKSKQWLSQFRFWTNKYHVTILTVGISMVYSI